MALSRVVSRAKRLADHLAPGVVAWRRRHKLERDLAARRRPLSAFSQADRRAHTPLVIFFAPEAGIGPHFISHMIVARTLKELGHRVLVLRCFEHLPRCIVMDSLSLPLAGRRAEHAQVCETCARRSLEMVDAYGLDVVDLGQLVDADMSAKIRAAMAAVGEDPEAFTFDGVAFGKMANGDVSRMLKINNPARA